MAESSLSNEVSDTTILPSPKIKANQFESGAVVIHFSPQDYVSGGNFTIERSTDGFSTVTTVATKDHIYNKYKDTNVSNGSTYEYRVKRDTGDKVSTSGTTSITLTSGSSASYSEATIEDLYANHPPIPEEWGATATTDKFPSATWVIGERSGAKEWISDTMGVTPREADYIYDEYRGRFNPTPRIHPIDGSYGTEVSYESDTYSSHQIQYYGNGIVSADNNIENRNRYDGTLNGEDSLYDDANTRPFIIGSQGYIWDNPQDAEIHKFAPDTATLGSAVTGNWKEQSPEGAVTYDPDSENIIFDIDNPTIGYNGSEQFRISPGNNRKFGIIHNGNFYRSGVHEINPSNGDPLRANLGIGNISINGDWLYGGQNDGTITSVKLDSFEIKHQVSDVASDSGAQSRPVPHNGFVFTCHNDRIVKRNAPDLTTIWEHDLGSLVPKSAVAIFGGVGLYQTDDGVTHAFDAEAPDYNELWATNTKSGMTGLNQISRAGGKVFGNRPGAVDGNETHLNTVNIRPPDSPKNPSTSVDWADIVINWDASYWYSDPGHYNVLRSTSSGSTAGDYTKVVDVPSGTTSFKDTTVDGGTTYYYRIEPVNSRGSGTLSAETTETAPTVSAPDAPQNLTSSVNLTDISLDWDSTTWNLDKGHYNILRATSSGSTAADYTQVAQVPEGTTTYTDSANDDTTYYYRVTAENGEGTSDVSNETSETTATIQPPTQPTNFTAALDTNDNPELNWDAVNWDIDEGHYNIYRATSSGSVRSDYTDIADVAAGTTTYTDTSTSDLETYYYRVGAENGGGTSDLSTEESVSTPGPPETPPNFTYSKSGSDVTLDWDPPDWRNYEGHVNVFRANVSGETVSDYTDIADVPAGTTTYTDSGLTDGESYFYRLNAESTKGTSDLTYEVKTVMGLPPGHIGNARTGGRRLGWPDWVFVDATSGDVAANGSIADPLLEANATSGSVSADGSIPTIELTESAFSGGVDVPGGILEPVLVADADSGGVGAVGSLAKTTLYETATSGEVDIEGNTANALLKSDATSGEVGLSGNVTIVLLKNDVTAGEVDVGGTAIPLEDYFSIINTDAVSGVVGAEGATTETNWNAFLGGVVKDPAGNPVDGAEVHIIRDNDDTKVASTTTDGNGEWSVTLPSGSDAIQSTDSDPPVYSIEVWYRDGPKRDPSSTLYKAENRPFIDTDDPSETNPYDSYYYEPTG